MAMNTSEKLCSFRCTRFTVMYLFTVHCGETKLKVVMAALDDTYMHYSNKTGFMLSQGCLNLVTCI